MWVGYSYICALGSAELREGGRRENREEVPCGPSVSKTHGREKSKQCTVRIPKLAILMWISPGLVPGMALLFCGLHVGTTL